MKNKYWIKQAVLIIIGIILFAILYNFIISEGNSSSKYKIIQVQGDYYKVYYTNHYELLDNGCIKFNDNILCGSYTIKNN